MTEIFKLTWKRYRYVDGFEVGRNDEPKPLRIGTMAECREAWAEFVTEQHFYGVDATPDKYESIGLLTKLGYKFSISIGREGQLALSAAPEEIENPTYEVRPAVERDAWVPAGDTLEDAEIVMRRMGENDRRLLILRNNENGALAVYAANSLGYLDFKGTHEQFYGAAR